MRAIILGMLAVALALAGCTADNDESTNTNGANGGSGSQVDGTVEVVEDTNSSTEGNATTNETVET